jgi:riboflavin biosynthesis pyrimidine reductase
MMVLMRQLLPEPISEMTVQDAYSSALGYHSDRPWVSLSMIASIDGSTVVDGNSGALSSPTDSAVLSQLRKIADVIIVGAGTVRGEGYGPPRKKGQRVGVITAMGSVDLTMPLFTSGAGFIITSIEGAIESTHVDVLRTGHNKVDLREAVRRIPELCPNARVVQAEGGAALNGSLLDADVLDEINVTTSPATVGGGGPRISSMAADHQHRFDVAQLAIDDESFLYARWLRQRAGS